jgi:hypothetical protein
MTEVGKNITSAFAFTSKAGKECEALAKLITVEISDLFRSTSLGSVYLPDKWSSSYRDEGWVRTDAAWSLPLTSRDENQPGVHLAFQMSFLCDNPAGGWSEEPILYINFWDEPTDVKRGEYMGFQMYGIAPPSIRRLKEGTARLFRWETDNGAADRWTFGLRLAEINGLDDIRNLITGPLTRLLTDVDAGEAALDQQEGVVTYSAVDEMQDYYRVIG